MKRITLMAGLTIFLLGCEKDTGPSDQCLPPPPPPLRIVLQDSTNGSNLLAPPAPRYNRDSIFLMIVSSAAEKFNPVETDTAIGQRAVLLSNILPTSCGGNYTSFSIRAYLRLNSSDTDTLTIDGNTQQELQEFAYRYNGQLVSARVGSAYRGVLLNVMK